MVQNVDDICESLKKENNMKKIITVLMTILITMFLTLTVAAQSSGCTVTAKDIEIQQKGQVTVPIEISSNNGFTNFAIALDYDREQLELISINIKDGETEYLCGELVSVNTEWTDTDGNTYGYIAVASETEITVDGVLFTATFNTTDNFTETATVTPVIKYMRNNTVLFSVFENAEVSVQPGNITFETGSETPEIIYGDLNGDGELTYKEVLTTLAAFRSKTSLSETQMVSADIDGDGELEYKEVLTILKNFRAGTQGE